MRCEKQKKTCAVVWKMSFSCNSNTHRSSTQMERTSCICRWKRALDCNCARATNSMTSRWTDVRWWRSRGTGTMLGVLEFTHTIHLIRYGEVIGYGHHDATAIVRIFHARASRFSAIRIICSGITGWQQVDIFRRGGIFLLSFPVRGRNVGHFITFSVQLCAIVSKCVCCQTALNATY